MALWAYVPDRVLAALVAELPAGAYRLDTGKWVADVEKWSRACGYWDVESPDVIADVQQATPWRTALTPEEVAALIAAFNEANDRAAGRRGYLLAKLNEWNGAAGRFQDWLDKLPPYELPNNGPAPSPQPPTTLAELRSTVQWMYGRLDPRVTYLHEHEERLTQTLIPLGNFMFTLAQALLDELERSETFVPPIGWLIE